MSYKDELEKRKVDRQAAAKREADFRQQTVDKIEARATELRQHIEANGAHELGVVLRQEGARILLQHSNSNDIVCVDTDVGSYRLMIIVEKGSKPFADPVRDSSSRVVQTIGEVDNYILDFLNRIDALNRK
jgi:hypothetical protein